MSSYLPPLRISNLFNTDDYNYQYNYLTYEIGDTRYAKIGSSTGGSSGGSGGGTTTFPSSYANLNIDSLTTGNVVCSGKIVTTDLSCNGNLTVGNIVCPNTLNVGTTASVINIGNNLTTVYIGGSTNFVTTTNLQVYDKTITLDLGGTDAANCGILINESNAITASILVSSDKQHFKVLLPFSTTSYNMLTTHDLLSSLSFTGIVNNGDTTCNGNLSVSGNLSIAGQVIQQNTLNVNDVFTSLTAGINNELVVGGSLGVGGALNVAGRLNTTDIYCNNIFTQNSPTPLNAGTLTNFTFNIPLCKSIADVAAAYTNLNLQSLLGVNPSAWYVFLQPYFSIVFYNNNIILQCINNTNNDILFQAVSWVSPTLNCSNIVILYKGQPV